VLLPVIDGVYWWQALQLELKRHINGYIVMTKVGAIMIDPPSSAEPILRGIEALGKPRAIILTGVRQQRRAAQYQAWYGAKVFAPEKDKRQLTIKADHYYRSGETLPGGFLSVGLSYGRSPGESALFHAKSRLLCASHLVGDPPGYVQMQEQGLYRNFSRAFEEQISLLELDFDTLLPGRGKPLAKDARLTMAKYLAGYGETEA
jgi:glyoxylase-like metal-dependent hydrolase (beta-lactamase superfamily II)